MRLVMWARAGACAALCLLALVPVAQAAVWRERMVVELPIGERDTRSRVRDGAVEEMRLRASRKVGTIVESSLRSDGQRITEELKMVGVSLVQVDEVVEQIRIDTKGTMWLEVSANVTVDESELERRAAAMRVDVEKARKIRQLTAENETLRRSLESIATSLRQKGSASDAADLLRRHAELTAALNDNKEQVGNAFAPGFIVDLSRQDAQGWTQVERALKEGVFEQIMASPVQAQIVRVEEAANGYTAMVRVGWNTNLNAVSKVLQTHLRGADVNSYTPGIEISWYKNNGSGVSMYSQRVFEYLASHRLMLEFDLGGRTFAAPVMYLGDGFSRKCSQMRTRPIRGDSIGDGSVCMASQSVTANELLGMDYNNRFNPMAVPLTKEQAQSATQIKAYWVLTRPDGSTFPKSAMVQGAT
ncbi:MAG: hypothetical protein IPH37_14170 [Burkholderiales bacterium]|nr:hypothetical protein [Burkholderiales bacterium]